MSGSESEYNRLISPSQVVYWISLRWGSHVCEHSSSCGTQGPLTQPFYLGIVSNNLPAGFLRDRSLWLFF